MLSTRYPYAWVASAMMLLVIVTAGCREVIPTAPAFKSTNARQYFWDGTPYNPAYFVTDSAGGTHQDILDLQSGVDSLLLSDGLLQYKFDHFQMFDDSILLDRFAITSFLPMPTGYYFSTGSIPTIDTFQLPVESVFLDSINNRTYAGTAGVGIWSTLDPQFGPWRESRGAPGAYVSGFARTEDGAIFAIGADSVYLSTDNGISFETVGAGKFSAIASHGNRAIFGGSDIEEITRPYKTLHLFNPQLPTNFTNSIIALAMCGDRLIAGVYQSSSTNHLISIDLGASSWQSPPQQPYTSTNMFALAANGSYVFAGTNGDATIASFDTGHSWEQFTASAGAGNIACYTTSAHQPMNYAGTTDGQLLAIRADTSRRFSVLGHVNGPITSMALKSYTRYFDSVVLVSNGRIYLQMQSNLIVSAQNPPSSVRTVTHYGTLKLLDATRGNLAVGAAWHAGYLDGVPDTIAHLVTARVVAHFDSLFLPLPTPKSARKDIVEVRYSIEDDQGSPVVGLPYWLIYYEKDFGPVITKLLTTPAGATQPIILNTAVYYPPD